MPHTTPQLRLHQVCNEEERRRRSSQAAVQARTFGRFVRNASNPGTSNSSRQRTTRRQRLGSYDDRERNIRDALSVLLVPGDFADYVPACVDQGPFTDLLRMIISEEHRPAKRVVFKVAKHWYLDRRNMKQLPRRDLKRNGSIVRKKVAVFSRYRFPRPDSTTDMSKLRALWNRFIQCRIADFTDINLAIESVIPFLKSYNSVTHEYSNYPPLPPGVEAFDTNAALMQSPSRRPRPHENLTVELPQERSAQRGPLSALDEQDLQYVQRVIATAQSDEEYILLEKGLLLPADGLTPFIGHLISQNLRNSYSNLELTSIEQAILNYTREPDSARRSVYQRYLEQFLVCCVRIRTYYRLPLMADIGYHPPLDALHAGI